MPLPASTQWTTTKLLAMLRASNHHWTPEIAAAYDQAMHQPQALVADHVIHDLCCFAPDWSHVAPAIKATVQQRWGSPDQVMSIWGDATVWPLLKNNPSHMQQLIKSGCQIDQLWAVTKTFLDSPDTACHKRALRALADQHTSHTPALHRLAIHWGLTTSTPVPKGFWRAVDIAHALARPTGIACVCLNDALIDLPADRFRDLVRHNVNHAEWLVVAAVTNHLTEATLANPDRLDQIVRNLNAVHDFLMPKNATTVAAHCAAVGWPLPATWGLSISPSSFT